MIYTKAPRRKKLTKEEMDASYAKFQQEIAEGRAKRGLPYIAPQAQSIAPEPTAEQIAHLMAFLKK